MEGKRNEVSDLNNVSKCHTFDERYKYKHPRSPRRINSKRYAKAHYNQTVEKLKTKRILKKFSKKNGLSHARDQNKIIS